MNRDELADGVDYYPDEYLNRLAHEGVTALWLSVSFKDLCVSEIFPEHGRDRERRYEKLRRTVAKCARYGIKIYPFVIEPCGFGSNPEYQHPLSVLERYPELAGHRLENGSVYFCVSSKTGREYLEDCACQIFSNVPGLGGMIDINMGERPTHCYSWVTSFTENNCPKCSNRPPWEVVNDTLNALLRGMRKAGSDGEFISWFYVPQFDDANGVSLERTMDGLKEIATHIPPDVTFQYNFESMGVATQLGKERFALDYFLSWPGPSDIFSDCAKAAVANGATASAKIQVGCSHEIATIPFIPVPGNLYKKYKAMRELGVSSVMQCWYFGNYPGIMNKAAGELSFEPFPENENEFLAILAGPDWGEYAPQVVDAWLLFQESYSNFPVNLGFTHYGPLHHAIVWPLYLFPVDKPISPSWKFTFPLECGDRIGECLCYDHTLEEALTLLDAMSELWGRGTDLLNSLSATFAEDRERMMDIALANAINLQISSAKNVFHFYALREELPQLEKAAQVSAFAEMKRIVHEEIKNSAEMIELCNFDSRLGFHSEAEGYKYDPNQLNSRILRLRELIECDFPRLMTLINNGDPLFSEYTGEKPKGVFYNVKSQSENPLWEKVGESGAVWNASKHEDDIIFTLKGKFSEEDVFTVDVEPCRLWPTQKFSVTGAGVKNQRNFKVRMDTNWMAEVTEEGMRITIPLDLFEGFHATGTPLRVNVHLNGDSWVKTNPLELRLRFGGDNPADLGWLFI
jgi:hypothetical protein